MHTKVSDILSMQYEDAKNALEGNLRGAVFNKTGYLKKKNCEDRIYVFQYLVNVEKSIGIHTIKENCFPDKNNNYCGVIMGNLKKRLPGIIGMTAERVDGGKNRVNHYCLKKEFIDQFDEIFETSGKKTLLELLAKLEKECS